MEDESLIIGLRKKAESGLTPHLIEIGHALLSGEDYLGNSVPKDFEEARVWLEKAHVKGATTATLLLGTIYEKGLGVNVNADKAKSLYLQAVKRGDYLPCFYLARIYAKEEKSAESTQMAFDWYRKVVAFDPSEIDEDDLTEAKLFLTKHSFS